MENLVDYISIYDNSLSEEVCDFLIEIYENNFNSHQYIDQNNRPKFTQLNLTQLASKNDDTKRMHNFLLNTIIHYKNKYSEIIDSESFPKKFAFEEIRIKKYKIREDLFDWHVDVKDYSSSKRFLSFLWYLNDVEDGGETKFSTFKIKPKKGRLIVFPPLWMFPHSGMIPLSNHKYILSTYLHYC